MKHKTISNAQSSLNLNRARILENMSAKLSSEPIYKKTVWLIMDKKRKIIAKGRPRNRYLCLLEDKKDRKRLLTYNSEGMAKRAFTGSGFYIGKGVHDYLEKEYNMQPGSNYNDLLEAVKATLIVRI